AVDVGAADLQDLLPDEMGLARVGPFPVLPLAAAADALLDGEHAEPGALFAQALVREVLPDRGAALDPEPGADFQVAPAVGEEHGHLRAQVDARLVARVALLGREG